MNNTTVESTTVVRNGIIELKLKKLPIDPYNENEDVRGWHRCTLEPGTNLGAAYIGINESLAGIGVAPIDADSWSQLVTLCAAAWTEEAVSAFRAAHA